MSEVGKVYLVGAGPGDPGLLTLKGQRCLAEADLVLYDGLVNPLLLRHLQATAERTSRVGTGGDRQAEQQEIHRRLIEAARAGKTVVRLKGGDPFIFGRGSEEAAALAEAGIPFEVVPGITAAIAAGEYAGISLTHRELSSAVAFVTGHEDPSKSNSTLDYSALARFPGTLVFYMGLHRIESITRSLIAQGKSPQTPVAVISRASTPRQRILTDSLENIAASARTAELKAPSLIIVGDCVTQRERIDWFGKLPLSGVTIGITRPEGQLDDAIDRALMLGAMPVLMPTIEIHRLSDWSEVDATIARLSEYDWIVFTSVNAVEAFLGRLWETGQDVRSFRDARIAAIGPATGARLESYSLRADLVPAVYRGEALAEALASHVAGKNVLWPRASRGREVIPEILEGCGAKFDSLVVYEHRDVAAFSPEVAEMIQEHELDWIALSSPTIARNLAKLLGKELSATPTRIAAISPVTAEAAREAGLRVDVIADEYTWEGLFQAIESSPRG